MNRRVDEHAGVSSVAEARLGYQEPASPLYRLKALSARAKEAGELSDQTELHALASLREGLQGVGASAIILKRVEYLDWRSDQIKAARDLERTETYFSTQYSRSEEESSPVHPDPDRDAFLRSRAYLLSNHRGKYVAFANGQLQAVAESYDALADQLEGRQDWLDVYIQFVEDAAFEDPPAVEVPSVCEA